MEKFLSYIPFNGYKRYIGLTAGIIATGLWNLGYIDSHTYVVTMTWLSLWTGVAFAHTQDKNAGTDTVVRVNVVPTAGVNPVL